jgi:hypothetical protein
MKNLLRLFVFVLVFSGLFSVSYGQISQGGQPLSFKLDEKDLLNNVPIEKMPVIDVEALKAEDEIVDPLKNSPWRFGKVHQVNLNPQNSGVWDILDDGSKIWRLNIACPDALSINILFDMYQLPKGAELFIYSSGKNELLGAFTDFNNQNDFFFATSFVFSSEIIVEYNEPANVEFEGILNISEITHGYRTIGDYTKVFGGSGWCNVNVACPSAAGMEDQIRSVAMLASSNGVSGGFCTGALINNTENNGIPYFLSADHCYSYPGSIFYIFNWESSTCSNPSSSPSYNTMSGATQRARNSSSDFWLVELNQTPPVNYNVYYSGWNRTTATSLSGKIWGIHHPSGDIKKISWSNNGVTTTQYAGSAGSGSTHWRIAWSDGTTTEGGSSGSPLFNSEGRIIGQLHGGGAACGNTLPDWYGKLSVSWTGNGTNTTRLSNWLDPAGTGATAINGYDPQGTNLQTIFAESFENSSFPPNGWGVGSNVTTHTWESSTGYIIQGSDGNPDIHINPQDGNKFAFVRWQTGQNQDEWLVSPSIDLRDANNLSLSFYFNGSYHWSVDEYDNCDLTVKARIGNGTWTDLWSEHNHGEWATYEWHSVNISNLTAYEGQNYVRFAWVYTGNDGANFNVDNIILKGNVEETINIDNLQSDFQNISVFPNPTSGNFSINSDKEYIMTIYGINGKKIDNIKIFEGINSVDIDDYEAGIYIINLKNDLEILSFKIIKK